MYLINILNKESYNDNAVVLWDGRDLSIVQGLFNYYLLDRDSTISENEISRVLVELKSKIENNKWGVKEWIGDFCFYLYPAIEGKVFDTYI